VIGRLALTLSENKRLLASASDAALTDSLSQLPNRRALTQDLDDLAATATPDNPVALVLFDLDGFKTYNDRYGHPAGDGLLQRLGERLALLRSPAVSVYRLGGDEFCLLAQANPVTTARLIDKAIVALSEKSEEYTVTASFGTSTMPEDATEVGEALRLADVRLYSRKADLYAGREHPHDQLLGVLNARDPGSSATRELAATIATQTAAALGLDPHAQNEIARATLLRDVGTLALPDALASPTRPLTDVEMQHRHQHPRIAERILSCVPLLRPLAPIVAASHENWDGSGYPTGTAGTTIPLAARIVAASTTYAELLSDPAEDSLFSFSRQAGKQLDPDLVPLLTQLDPIPTELPATAVERANRDRSRGSGS